MAIGTNGKIGIGLLISAILGTGLYIFVGNKIKPKESKSAEQHVIAGTHEPYVQIPTADGTFGGSRRRRKSKKRK
jgi:hypothetical protein